MQKVILISAIVLLAAALSSCCTTKKADSVQPTQGKFYPGPKVMIYKTTKDYSKLVPVILSKDKTSIESYPDVKDVFYNENLAYPTPLHQGYLLDNRGINENVAFISLSYEEYSKLAKTPTSEELIKLIIDKNPLSVLYMYGVRPHNKDLETELNLLIDAGDFKLFTKLK